MAVHKDLTGADLHEPKGADTATSGKVYVSDGAGSGAWTTASSVITNTAFTTGDLKATHKVTADTSWIMWGNSSGYRTIGDGSSAAEIRANADTADLFALYWDNYSNTLCPVYTSAGVASTRGASAAADYAAHKRIAVPAGIGRVLGLAGTPTDLATARTVGSSTGAETVTLVSGNIPTLASTGSNSISVTSSLSSYSSGNTIGSLLTNGSGAYYGSGALTPQSIGSIVSTGTNTINVSYTNASPTGVSTYQPTAFVNVMIKL